MQIQSNVASMTGEETEQKWSHWTGGLIRELTILSGGHCQNGEGGPNKQGLIGKLNIYAFGINQQFYNI